MKQQLRMFALLALMTLPMGVMGQVAEMFQTYIIQNTGSSNFYHAGGINADGDRKSVV